MSGENLVAAGDYPKRSFILLPVREYSTGQKKSSYFSHWRNGGVCETQAYSLSCQLCVVVERQYNDYSILAALMTVAIIASFRWTRRPPPA